MCVWSNQDSLLVFVLKLEKTSGYDLNYLQSSNS